MKQNKSTIILCTVLVLLAAILRMVNAEYGWYNFGPLAAMSLFSGTVLGRKPLAFILPLAAYFISDAYMQFAHHNGFYGISQSFVYGAMIIIALFGSMMKKQNVLNVLGFSIGGTLLFWIISNFGVFAGGYWGTGVAGFTKTYLMALPFYKNEFATDLFLNALLGDIIFSGALFGIYGLLNRPSVYAGQLAK